VVAWLDGHPHADVVPPIQSWPHGQDDPVLRRRLLLARRDQQAGPPHAIWVELLDDDAVEQGAKLVTHEYIFMLGPGPIDDPLTQGGFAPSAAAPSVAPVRLIVARCEVRYSGRLSAVLPEAVRLLMIKADGSFLVHADAGGYKPLNWMTPPTAIEESDGIIVVRKRGAASEDRLAVSISEVLSDTQHEMASPDQHPGLAKDGVEADLQELLAERPECCGEGFRLVRREWPTDIGPVDLMCRDGKERWVAVEIKRVGGIDAVEQLSRYLERIRRDPAFASCRGVLAAQTIKPQARVLAQSRDIECAEIDLAVLRGERKPDLRLFAA
jgi:RecB family endonuclease NucS